MGCGEAEIKSLKEPDIEQGPVQQHGRSSAVSMMAPTRTASGSLSHLTKGRPQCGLDEPTREATVSLIVSDKEQVFGGKMRGWCDEVSER